MLSTRLGTQLSVQTTIHFLSFKTSSFKICVLNTDSLWELPSEYVESYSLFYSVATVAFLFIYLFCMFCPPETIRGLGYASIMNTQAKLQIH